jgi:hypothetical protein
MAETFQDFIASERSRLNSEREAIFAQQQQLDEQLAVINQEMHAIDAYEAAKSGKAPARKTTGTRELLEKLGLKGNKSGEMSVSNALTALTKANQVVRKDGKYVASMG